MHRHGFKKHHLSGNKDSRRVLIRSLAGDLIQRRSLTTSLPKAKAVLPFVERLITKAKQGGLHQRRQVIAKLGSIKNAHTLVDQWAPRLGHRTSGHLRLEKLTTRRRGDGALMARVSFVDSLEDKEEAAEDKPADAKVASRPASKSKKPKPQQSQPKRTPAKSKKKAAS